MSSNQRIIRGMYLFGDVDRRELLLVEDFPVWDGCHGHGILFKGQAAASQNGPHHSGVRRAVGASVRPERSQMMSTCKRSGERGKESSQMKTFLTEGPVVKTETALRARHGLHGHCGNENFYGGVLTKIIGEA